MIPYHRDSLSTKSLYNKIATPRSQRRPVIRRSPYSQSQIHPHSLGIGPCAKAASVQSFTVVRQAGFYGIGSAFGYGLTHQIGKGGQGHKLARSEEVAEVLEPI